MQHTYTIKKWNLSEFSYKWLPYLSFYISRSPFSLTVQGQDTSPPVISGCPASITFMSPIGSTQLEITWTEPTAVDNSGLGPIRTQTHQPTDSFPVGTTAVTYTFTDQAGNSAECSFDVTIGKDFQTPSSLLILFLTSARNSVHCPLGMQA